MIRRSVIRRSVIRQLQQPTNFSDLFDRCGSCKSFLLIFLTISIRIFLVFRIAHFVNCNNITLALTVSILEFILTLYSKNDCLTNYLVHDKLQEQIIAMVSQGYCKFIMFPSQAAIGGVCKKTLNYRIRQNFRGGKLSRFLRFFTQPRMFYDK